MKEKRTGCQKIIHKNGLKFKRYKIEKLSNIGFVTTKINIDGSNFDRFSDVVRHFESHWNRLYFDFKKEFDINLIFFQDLKESSTLKNSLADFTVRFELNNLSRFLDELIYELIEELIFTFITTSKVKVN